jgi:DNA-binding response OmpR family regulator
MRGSRSNRLLLVEDDTDLSDMLTEVLVDEGYVGRGPSRRGR